MTDIGSMISTVDARTLQERVYDEIRRALLQGSFSLGQSLTIRGLASAMGTSEMPVREAIKRLVAEKMITQLSNRTFKVPVLDRIQFEEILSLRVAMEGMAAQRACQFVDTALIGRLKALNEEMRAALREKKQKDALRCNQEFHFAIYAAAGSTILVDMIETLWMRSGPYLAEALAKIEDATSAFHEATLVHDQLIASLERKDEAATFSALKDDIWNLAQWYESHVDEIRLNFSTIKSMKFPQF